MNDNNSNRVSITKLMEKDIQTQEINFKDKLEKRKKTTQKSKFNPDDLRRISAIDQGMNYSPRGFMKKFESKINDRLDNTNLFSSRTKTTDTQATNDSKIFDDDFDSEINFDENKQNKQNLIKKQINNFLASFIQFYHSNRINKYTLKISEILKEKNK